MSYTKGKWSFGHNVGVYSGETHIADIAPVNNGFDETLANAKLIAAAPGLLEALIEVVRISDRNHEAWDKAKAAINKATH